METKDKERDGYIGFQSRKQKSLLTQRYKLITVDGENFELYDLIQDKYEKSNIAAANPEIVAELKQQLEDWVKSCKNSDGGNDY